MKSEMFPPQLLVLVSRGLQSLATPVVALLVATAAQLGEEVEDAISVCNVLFVGNLCASLVVLITFGPRRINQQLQRLAPRVRFELYGFAALSAMLSSLIFTALETTTVTNVVLLARLGPVLYVIGSAIVFTNAIRKPEWMGFSMIVLGVLATVFAGNRFHLAWGDLLILVSTVFYAAVTMMSKRLLPSTGLPALVFARNFFSAIFFFVLANILFGPSHFVDAFYGPLWAIMLVYALVVVVVAQFAWYKAIAVLSPASVARWTVLTPVLAFGYAFVINGERPTLMHVVALVCVTTGIVVSNLGKFTPPGTSDNAESSVAGS